MQTHMELKGVFGIWLAVAFGALLVIAWGSRRIWQRRKQMSRGARVVAALAAGACLSGAFGVTMGIVQAFTAFRGDDVDPSQKARIVAEGISNAMNATAFSLVVWVLSCVALIWALRKPKPR